MPAPATGLTAVHARRVLLPGGRWGGPGTVTMAAGRITQVAEGAPAHAGGALTPGLLDVHNNGAFGEDFAASDAAGVQRVLAGLAARGVTAVLPTVITAPLAGMRAALDRLAALPAAGAGARVLGVHVEGPFLSPLRRGAHRADWLALPSVEAVAGARMVTLAPELPGALDVIRRLAAAGVLVSLGHSDADAAVALAAAEAGAACVTHLFNAMRPFAHRDPGLAGLALADARLWCCLIVDGVHVDPVACRVAFAAAGRRLVAVSDSILVAGLPPGSTLPFGGAMVTAGADGAGRRADGTLAGGGIVLDEGMRRMIAAGIPAADVLHAASEAPARMLGRDDLGRLAAGALADVVWWDDDWVPRRVWVGGSEVGA